MPRPAPEQDGSSHARGARTKRTRTRAALIAAAGTAFATQTWAATRVEDVAEAAGVSVATAYNHFPTKHALIGAVFAPHLDDLLAKADRDIADGKPVVDALSGQIDGLARLTWRHHGLTSAFTAAVFEYTIRVSGPPVPDDHGDPRNIARLIDVILGLVRHGQATGELRSHPSAMEISAVVVNLLLVRSINRVNAPPEATADLLQTILFGALCPEQLDRDRTIGREPPSA